MNPKTVGIFAGAATLCVVALFLVVRSGGGGPPAPPPTAPVPPTAPTPAGVSPQAEVRFGERVQAHAAVSQSHVLTATSSELFLNVDLTAADLRGTRQPFAAALVIDRSGSMAGAKIDSARDAALAFLGRMRDDDQIAVVTYGSDVTLDVRLERVGSVRTLARQKIARIDAGGGTNISGGLKRAIRELERANGARRIVLISDGRPTEGERSPRRLASIAADGRELGQSFSTIGVGLDYDENVMESIAMKGGGGYHHLRRASALGTILAQEFKTVESIVAADLRLLIEPGEHITIDEVFGHDLERQGRAVVVRVGDLSAGEKRRLVSRTTVRGTAPGLVRFAGLALSYRVPATGGGESAAGSLSVASTDQTHLVSSSFKADVVVAGHQVEAAAAVQESMKAMAGRDRKQAVRKLKKAKARLRDAATRAPAAAAPILRQQADDFEALEGQAADIGLDSDDGKDWVKRNRADSYSSQRSY